MFLLMQVLLWPSQRPVEGPINTNSPNSTVNTWSAGVLMALFNNSAPAEKINNTVL